MKNLLIDDERDSVILSYQLHCVVDSKDLTVARTYKDGIKKLESESWDILFLDNDLGEKKEGYDVICWLEEHQECLPKQIICVSGNPVRREVINKVIRSLYAKD